MKLHIPRIFTAEKVLVIAIASSLGWHLLWLSAVKIVSEEPVGDRKRFSSVSFLGPTSAGAAIEARTAYGELFFLEERYRQKLHGHNFAIAAAAEKSSVPVADGRDIERRMAGLIERSIEGEKMRPGSPGQ